MNTNSGGLSLSYQLEHQLRDKIVSGELPPGSRIAPEVELARHHGVSVVTVQRALAGLSKAGLISRTRGRGTYVLKMPAHLQARPLPTSMEMIFAPDFGDRTAQVLSQEVVETPSRVADLLDEAHCLEVRRLLKREGVVQHYSINLIRQSCTGRRRLGARALKRLPMGRLLRDELGLDVRQASARLQARNATTELASLLHTDVAAPVFYMFTSFLEGDRVVAVNEIYFRADLYEFHVEYEHLGA